jgi:probable F420-dependent oxidoreductase
MMKVGVGLRNLGPAATVENILTWAGTIDAVPAISDLWVTDHIAIPPDEAEGSEGHYLDPLALLAFLAGVTSRVGLGTSVLVLPYRPMLPTAKWIATIQELSRGRVRLGVGAGWMEAEFRSLGVARARRGRLMDDTLGFLDRCFAAPNDVVDAHGQRFFFRPRPPRPPIFIGGAPPHAFRRAVAHDAGWMPVGLAPEMLHPLAEMLNEQASAAGLGRREIATMTSLPLSEPSRTKDLLAAYATAGATRVIHSERYATGDDLRRIVDQIACLG